MRSARLRTPFFVAVALACVAAYTAPDQAGLVRGNGLEGLRAAYDSDSDTTDHMTAPLMLTANQEKSGKSGTTATSSTCDPSWCNCKDAYCKFHEEEESCDLCSQKFLFVLSASGQTGSASLIEGLNALPGVSLSGENRAVVEDLRSAFNYFHELASIHRRSQETYIVPNPEGKRTLCGEQSNMIARWEGAPAVSRDRKGEADAGTGDQIFGFKELLQLPSFDAGGEFPHEEPHLSTRLLVHEGWIEFLETLFPCSRIVLNLRRDMPAQARAVLATFFDANGGTDIVDKSLPPLDLIEKELETVSQFMLEWHQNRSSSGRSFLMYEEEMTAERLTQLAHWLGKPCTFGAAPDANEFDPKSKRPYYYHSSAPVNVSCTDTQLDERTATDGKTRHVMGTAPEAPLENKQSFTYDGWLIAPSWWRHSLPPWPPGR